MKKEQIKKSGKFQKVMKWMGIVELALLIGVIVYFSGIWEINIKIDENSNGQFYIDYHGQGFIQDNDFIWSIDGTKHAGVSRPKKWIHKSTGAIEDMFLIVSCRVNDYYPEVGIYVREDIQVPLFKSDSVNKIRIGTFENYKTTMFVYDNYAKVETTDPDLIEKLFSFTQGEPIDEIENVQSSAFFDCYSSAMPDLHCRIYMWKNIDTGQYYIETPYEKYYSVIDDDFAKTILQMAFY